jgi:hypothetical protein
MKLAHSRRKCVTHGGGQLCQVPRCFRLALQGGVCSHHLRYPPNVCKEITIDPIAWGQEAAVIDNETVLILHECLDIDITNHECTMLELLLIDLDAEEEDWKCENFLREVELIDLFVDDCVLT